MGKHREPRPRRTLRAALPLRTVLNAAVPVVLLLVLGVLAFVTTGLRPAADPERLTDPSGSTSGTSSANSPAPEPGPTSSAETGGDGLTDAQRRAAARLAAKAAGVPTRQSGRLPRAIPKGFVRVAPETLGNTSFVVSSFNVLGFGHTVRGGNKKGWAGGYTRMTWATTLLRSHGVSVAGLQEFQAPQFRHFMRIAGGEYAVYPGLSLGSAPVHNSIVWRKADWELVQAATTPIPYFRGHRLPMPHVLLRHRQTGREVWFANYHNPADAHGPAQRWRNLAATIEAGLVNRLQSDGTPVVVTGDMNDREEYFCRVGQLAGLRSADGGYVDGAGCHPPRRMNVDWILGTPDLLFSGFVTDRSPLVRRTTDHPMVRATATLPPVLDPASCLRIPGRRAIYCPAG